MDEDTLGTSRKRKGKENGLRVIDYAEDNTEMSLEEENEDEDMLAMDDNPSDLDYQPVPIIRYVSYGEKKQCTLFGINAPTLLSYK